MCYEFLFKNKRSKRQVHALNIELKKRKISEMKKKIENIENINETNNNSKININKNSNIINVNKHNKNENDLNNNNEYANNLKKIKIEGPIHFNFLNRPIPNYKDNTKKNNKNKIIVPKLTLDIENSKIYKRRMKKTTSKSKSTLV